MKTGGKYPSFYASKTSGNLVLKIKVRDNTLSNEKKVSSQKMLKARNSLVSKKRSLQKKRTKTLKSAKRHSVMDIQLDLR